MGFPVAQTVKNVTALQETRVWSLGQEDPLEKGIATHSSILAWRSPWTEEPGGLQSMGSQTAEDDWVTNTTSTEIPHILMVPNYQENTLGFLDKVKLHLLLLKGFPDGSVVKNPPALQETRVWSLGGEDPLEKEMATHSSLLAGRIPWTEKPGGL